MSHDNYRPHMIRSHRRPSKVEPMLIAIAGIFLAALTLFIAFVMIAT